MKSRDLIGGTGLIQEPTAWINFDSKVDYPYMDTKACCNTGSGKKTPLEHRQSEKMFLFGLINVENVWGKWICIRNLWRICLSFNFILRWNWVYWETSLLKWQCFYLLYTLRLCKKHYFYLITFVEVGCVTESPGIWVECEMDMASWSSSCTYIQHTPISIPRKFSIETQQTKLQLQQTVFVWVPGQPNNPVLSAWFLWEIMIYLFDTHHYLNKNGCIEEIKIPDKNS